VVEVVGKWWWRWWWWQRALQSAVAVLKVRWWGVVDEVVVVGLLVCTCKGRRELGTETRNQAQWAQFLVVPHPTMMEVAGGKCQVAVDKVVVGVGVPSQILEGV
jgi:hypothetical protein